MRFSEQCLAGQLHFFPCLFQQPFVWPLSLRRGMSPYKSTEQVKFPIFSLARRMIRLTYSNAMANAVIKKITLKGTLQQVFYLSEVPSPPMTLIQLTTKRVEGQKFTNILDIQGLVYL
jgi:hypothetical protein